jgi:hypothetical protein
MLRDAPLDLSVASLPTCAAEYRSGDIVWAKVKGFPWWPAKVCTRHTPPVLFMHF